MIYIKLGFARMVDQAIEMHPDRSEAILDKAVKHLDKK